MNFSVFRFYRAFVIFKFSSNFLLTFFQTNDTM